MLEDGRLNVEEVDPAGVSNISPAAGASGDSAALDTSAAPPLIEVVTNKPGQGERGAHMFVDGTRALDRLTPGEGLRVELFADERQFPDQSRVSSWLRLFHRSTSSLGKNVSSDLSPTSQSRRSIDA